MIRTRRVQRCALFIVFWFGVGLLTRPAGVSAQGFTIGSGDAGIGIGDVPRLNGLRLNFRDRHLEWVRGVNVTIWTPHEDADGVVRGVALGVPLTGADEIHGLALAFGVGAEEDLTGVGLAPIGIGAGDRLRGIMIGGIGAGAGGSADGILLGGVGVGAGGNVRGIVAGVIGAGAGGDLTGLGLGGVGIGAAGTVRGIIAGGVGVGAGEDVRGIAIGGVGVGAGGEIVGLAIGGVGVGAGGGITGLALAGGGVGSPRIRGAVLSLIGAGSQDAKGVVIAPAYFRIADDGIIRGVSVSAFNDIRGEQRGVAIGLLNITNELHGLQIGLINIARNKDRLPVLPLFNYNP